MTTAVRGALLTALAVLLVTPPALAGFQAADLIYIPAAASTAGAGASIWQTDLFITNVDDVAIDVAMVYLPSGLNSNAGYFSDRTFWLGGREADGFGFIDETLADIPPNGTVVLRDVIGQYWVDQIGLNGLGAMVVFAYEADTLEDDGTRVYRNAIVNARIYNATTFWQPDPDGHGFTEQPASFGQDMPGVPWYDVADPAAIDDTRDLTYMVLTGGEETTGYRYNLGVVNVSDPQTQITISLQAFQADGEPYTDADGNPLIAIQTVPVLAHLQWFRAFSTLWGLDEAESAIIKVSFVAWQSSAPDPVPGFVVYGSMIDNSVNDATTIMGAFGDPYDIACMWPTSGGTPAAPGGSSARRPLDMPPR
jgi:hypothetical protein